MSLPVDMHFDQPPSTTNGACKTVQQTLRCQLGVVAVGETVVIGVSIRSDIAGTKPLLFSVSSLEPDGQPEDNVLIGHTVVTAALPATESHGERLNGIGDVGIPGIVVLIIWFIWGSTLIGFRGNNGVNR